MSLAEALEVFQRHLRSYISELALGSTTPSTSEQLLIPFSRAQTSDLRRLTELWLREGVDVADALEPRSCPGCLQDDHQFIFRSHDGYPFHSCIVCSTWFVPFAVSEAFVQEFLDSNEEAAAIAAAMAEDREFVTRDADHDRFSGYFRHIEGAFDYLRRQKRYLDLGCGVGHSLDVAKDFGFESFGIEINEVSVRTGRKHGRSVLRPDEMPDNQSFDLISAFETLEHLPNPDEQLEHVSRMMSPKGLFLLTVPNRDSWEIGLMRERSVHVYGGVDGVGHINLFTNDSIRRMLARHDLMPVFSDGQFSSNPFAILKTLSNAASVMRDPFGMAEEQLEIPTFLYDLVNSLGPYWAAVDRLSSRAPITFMIACKSSASEDWRPLTQKLIDSRLKDLRMAGVAE